MLKVRLCSRDKKFSFLKLQESFTVFVQNCLVSKVEFQYLLDKRRETFKGKGQVRNIYSPSNPTPPGNIDPKRMGPNAHRITQLKGPVNSPRPNQVVNPQNTARSTQIQVLNQGNYQIHKQPPVQTIPVNQLSPQGIQVRSYLETKNKKIPAKKHFIYSL